MTAAPVSVFVVFGVSGSGKTSIGSALAQRLGWAFADADTFHPASNIEKMRAGRPLTDEDRKPWLAAIVRWIDEKRHAGVPAVVTCSALKRRYRDLLVGGHGNVRLVYLKGDFALIERRMTQRSGHFMPVKLLGSQFADLEEPEPDEHALTVSIAPPIDEIVATILRLADLQPVHPKSSLLPSSPLPSSPLPSSDLPSSHLQPPRLLSSTVQPPELFLSGQSAGIRRAAHSPRPVGAVSMSDEKKTVAFPVDELLLRRQAAQTSLQTDPEAPAAPQKGDITERPLTLAIDIGGSSLKAAVLDSKGAMVTSRLRIPTPNPATPANILAGLTSMVRNLEPYDRVSIGFPGMVRDGRVLTAPNLGSASWANFALADAASAQFGKPTRVLNDADVQGLGVIEGKGLEVVLTLGTGMGSALFKDGVLLPHLELGQHPIRRGMSYDQYVGQAGFSDAGHKKWNKRLRRVIETVRILTNFDRLHLGGGNAKHITGALPEQVCLAQNIGGITGGVHLWDDALSKVFEVAPTKGGQSEPGGPAQHPAGVTATGGSAASEAPSIRKKSPAKKGS